MNGLLLRPNARILYVTDKYEKGRLLAVKLLGLGGGSNWAKEFAMGVQIRIGVARPGDEHWLSSGTATHIFYDQSAGYSDLMLYRLKTMLRSPKYDGEFMLRPFDFEEITRERDDKTGIRLRSDSV